jgi:hypothetical protein
MTHTTDDTPLGPLDGDYVRPAEPYVPDDYDEPRPTAKQLKYLRALASRAGQTFTYPKTASQASAEIRRLQKQHRSSRLEVQIERKHIADQVARGPVSAANVDLDRETEGYRSTATWR